MIDKKGDIFGVRMAPEDKDKLGELAHAQRRSRSDVVRALVRQAYEAQASTSTAPSPPTPPGSRMIELRESMPGAPSVMDLIQQLRERKSSPDAALLDLQSAARDLVGTLTPQAVAESPMSTDSLLALTQDLIDVLRVLADGLRQRQDGAGTASSQTSRP